MSSTIISAIIQPVQAILPFQLTIWRALALAIVTYLGYGVFRMWKVSAAFNHRPGYRKLLSYDSIIGRLLIPTNTPYVNDHYNAGWDFKTAPYLKSNTSILGSFSTQSGVGNILCVGPLAVKQLSTDRKHFIKPVKVYQLLKHFGSNVLVTEGDEWRMHRRIAAPGFNEGVFDLVWQVTTQIYFEMARGEGWDKLKVGEKAEVKDVPGLMLRMAMAVLATASFGAPLQWDLTISSGRTSGHKLSFVESIVGSSDNLFLLLLLPKLVFRLPFKRLRHAYLAQSELFSYMHEMILQRKAELRRGEYGETRKDLFNQLIKASMQAEDDAEVEAAGGGKTVGDVIGAKFGKGLSDSELIGNTFIFALAGHETSAHTLAFTFAYLSLYSEIQEWLFEELKDVLPDGHMPSYADFPKLERSLATFYETLRLHPPVVLIPKMAAEDGFLQDEVFEHKASASDEGGEKVTKKREEEAWRGEGRRMFVPKGTMCNIDVVNLHMHPGYWENAAEFKPERFLGDYNKDAFQPFSSGPRGCIGRRFAEIEGVAILAMIIRHFKIHPSIIEGETFEERKARLLKVKFGVTLTPVKVELIFERREGGVTRPTYEA